jgi:hypothetical protein
VLVVDLFNFCTGLGAGYTRQQGHPMGRLGRYPISGQ